MNYYIEIHSTNKAKNDIDDIVRDMGFRNLTPIRKRDNMFSRFIVKLCGVIRVLTKLKRGDILLLQYPMKKFYKMACIFAHLKGAKVVTVIHDLGTFRRHKLTPQQENRRLGKTDFIIVHNDKMKEHLIQHGCQAPLHSLEIFDYLSKTTPATYPVPHHPWSVVYAGGLAQWRNGFLYHLDPHIRNWTLDIYGKGFEEEHAQGWKHINYHGFIDSETFVAQTEADFGLVWDGGSLDECTGDWGVYLKINNPHKTSFYLRSGIPVIVWEQAAMAPFIREQGIGLCVKSLSDLNNTFDKLTEEEYRKMKENAIRIGKMLGDGYFIKQSLDMAIKSLA